MVRKEKHLLMGFAGAITLLGIVGFHWVKPAVHADAQQSTDTSPVVAVNAAGGEGKGSREADKMAIKKATESFIKAFEKGDAKALVAHWTAEGEYVADDGAKYQGREELEKVYGEFFKEHKDLKVQVEMETLRFPSSNTAVEEGYLKLKKGKTGEYVTSKYSVLHVKEDGKWLMAIVREWPGEGLNLRDLEWLIGTWQTKREGSEVTTTYEWDENKAFIVSHFTIKEKDRTLKGKQIIAKDAATGLLRSWTFEGQGGFGEATWSRDGKKWVTDAVGTLPSGSVLTATNIITPLNDNTFLWHTVNRVLDDQELPDIAPIKVNRVKQTSGK